jgi:hypothetical protein
VSPTRRTASASRRSTARIPARSSAGDIAQPRVRDPAEALAERDAVVHAFPALSEPAARRCASSPGTGSRTPPPPRRRRPLRIAIAIAAAGALATGASVA